MLDQFSKWIVNYLPVTLHNPLLPLHGPRRRPCLCFLLLGQFEFLQLRCQVLELLLEEACIDEDALRCAQPLLRILCRYLLHEEIASLNCCFTISH